MEPPASMILREPTVEDWPAIRGLAEASRPWADNRAWLVDRISFELSSKGRWHSVAELPGHIAAYAAVEEGPADGEARIVLVADATALAGGAGDPLWRHLERAAAKIGPARLWAEEDQRSTELIAFLLARGFKETGKRTEKKAAMLRLERSSLDVG